MSVYDLSLVRAINILPNWGTLTSSAYSKKGGSLIIVLEGKAIFRQRKAKSSGNCGQVSPNKCWGIVTKDTTQLMRDWKPGKRNRRRERGGGRRRWQANLEDSSSRRGDREKQTKEKGETTRNTKRSGIISLATRCPSEGSPPRALPPPPLRQSISGLKCCQNDTEY